MMDPRNHRKVTSKKINSKSEAYRPKISFLLTLKKIKGFLLLEKIKIYPNIQIKTKLIKQLFLHSRPNPKVKATSNYFVAKVKK